MREQYGARTKSTCSTSDLGPLEAWMMLRYQGAAKILLIKAAEDGPYSRSWSSDKSVNTCQDRASAFKLPCMTRKRTVSSFALFTQSNGSRERGHGSTRACPRCLFVVPYRQNRRGSFDAFITASQSMLLQAKASMSLCLLLMGTTTVRPCCCPLSTGDLFVTVLLEPGLRRAMRYTTFESTASRCERCSAF